MSDTYIALTIGPIHKTLTSVKSTKAIWAASYMFSWIMREVIRNFKDTNTFLVPYVKEPHYFQEDEIKRLGVGLFPDRFIFVWKEGQPDFDSLQSAIEEVLKRFSEEAMKDLQKKRAEENRKENYTGVMNYKGKDMFNFLRKYVRAYSLEVSLDEHENPADKINQYLDSMELQEGYIEVEDAPYLKDLFENVFYNFLVWEGFGENKFPSTVEIATYPLRKIDSASYDRCAEHLRKEERPKPKSTHARIAERSADDAQQRFLNSLRKSPALQASMRFYHKYIAIVQADGDNMGEFIKQLFHENKDRNGNKISIEKRFSLFSKQLMKFSACAVTLIKAYGGTPVYAGGDDLLYFAPVATSGGLEPRNVVFEDDAPFNFFGQEIIGRNEPNHKSILWLMDKIDLLFNKLIAEHGDFAPIIRRCEKKPSLSFGASLSYYKFPLNEALRNALSLLFDEAKQGQKNSISYAVLKHSGQFFGATYRKEKPSYAKFKEMLSADEEVSEKSFLPSVMYKLEAQKRVLEYAATDDRRLAEFFRNNFNEVGHRGNKAIYLDHVRQLVSAVFKDDADMELDKRIAKLVGSLRFIHFLMDGYHD